jgi:type VI secretion system secreted protein VgrG
VSRFTQSGTVGGHAHYQADIVPWPWYLTRTTDCRIFQKKSLPEIVKQLFGEYGLSDYELRLAGTYPREYCVQYRETGFNFIARLFEEEGIFYFFAHENGEHTLLIADSARAYEPYPVRDQVRFLQEQVSTDDEDVVTWFAKEQEVRAGKCSLTDFAFEKPSLDLSASATGADSRAYEIYDYPAGGTTRRCTERLVRIRQQEKDATRVLFRGKSYARSLRPGFKFTMRAVGGGRTPPSTASTWSPRSGIARAKDTRPATNPGTSPTRTRSSVSIQRSRSALRGTRRAPRSTACRRHWWSVRVGRRSSSTSSAG